MDFSVPGFTNSLFPTASVFADNVQDLFGTGDLQARSSAIIAVNSLDDAINSSPGVTTLRSAINQANADIGEAIIVFDRSLFSSHQTIKLNLGELNITDHLQIIAPRDSLTGRDLLTVSGNNASRVFDIGTGATVNLFGLTVADGKVTGDSGGGIKNFGTLTLDSCIVINNSATAASSPIFTGGYGGGIFNGYTLIVNNSIISNNSASSGGGGIANNESSIRFDNSFRSVEVNNTTISGNTGGRDGGGILNYGDNSALKVSDSFLSHNSGGYGGGIYMYYGTVDISNSTISDNSANFGGGIRGFRGILDVSNSTISDNSAIDGGGIDDSSSTFTVSNSTIRDNFASRNGGGISGTAVVNNSNISNNSASNGGGIYGSGTISYSTISNNSASTNGGGISGSAVVDNSTISNNFASTNGGGIYGSGTISYSTINNNSASNGGGIYNANATTVILNNSTLSNNSASNNGGGLYNTAIELQVGGSRFSVRQGIVNVNSSTFSDNKAGNAGGGIYNLGGVLSLQFSTFAFNQAGNGGGVFNGVFNSPRTGSTLGFAKVRNTIIAYNLLTANGINPDVSGSFISNGYNLIGDSTSSTGFDPTIDIVGTSTSPIDPRLALLNFNGGSTQTLALLPDSPAIDAGDPTVLDTDPTTDQRGLGFPRVIRGRADIGAFEFGYGSFENTNNDV